MGTATAAFAQAVLEGATQPGVWYPEQVSAAAVPAPPPARSLLAWGAPTCPARMRPVEADSFSCLQEGGVAVAARARLLERAAEGCIQYVTNK